MEIPWQELDEETLFRLLSELVTRDGTDYGLQERSTEAKVASVKKSLLNKQAFLVWNHDTESASLMSPEQARAEAEELKKLEQQVGIVSDD